MKDNKPFESPDITYENCVVKYTISETTESSVGLYKVVAKNKAGTAEAVCELKVQEKPKIIYDESLTSQKITTSGQWKIDTVVKGYPKPTITWKKNSNTISERRILISTEDTSSSISINSVGRDDTATYTITATNEIGTDKAEFHLTVIGKGFFKFSFPFSFD